MQFNTDQSNNSNSTSYEEFVDNSIQSCETSIKKYKTVVNPKFNKPSWNNACAQALANKKGAYRKYLSELNLENFLSFTCSEARAKLTIKSSKKIFRDNFVTSSIKILRDSAPNQPVVSSDWVMNSSLNWHLLAHTRYIWN
ncbi:hypothetical protein WA026_018740 [Henosepilachna vigintioctopunctata]|uniref:Uncharacterized protein n=1 Tax=Henosepilachna vigintioctopunctata TaxID=420089 RepID=A0AAW1TMB4_9CUCU